MRPEDVTEELLTQLNGFLGRAALKTYAGGGKEVDPEEPGSKKLVYSEGKWHYEDNYRGFFRSWGHETIRIEDEFVWEQNYGGGMTHDYITNVEFAHETFAFLKKALSAGEKENEFQPRGPREFREGDWTYYSFWKGDITSFVGEEFFKILQVSLAYTLVQRMPFFCRSLFKFPKRHLLFSFIFISIVHHFTLLYITA